MVGRGRACTQRPLSSRLPDGGRTTGRRRKNHVHRRLIPERTTGSGVQPVCDGARAKSVPWKRLDCQGRAHLDEVVVAPSKSSDEPQAPANLPPDIPFRPTSEREGPG